MTKLSNERLAEQGIEVLRRLSKANVSLSDASFIAQWATDVRAVLRQSHSTGAVVKGLEWMPVHGEGVETYEANSILPGSYRVFLDEDSAAGAIFTEWAAEPDHLCMTYVTRLGRFHSWEAAKAAAQADYESRILSALYPHPKEAEVTDSDLLAAMKKHVGWELDWGPEDRHDEESDFGWRVFERSGGRSDLEWTLLGFGETPRAALVAALSRKG